MDWMYCIRCSLGGFFSWPHHWYAFRREYTNNQRLQDDCQRNSRCSNLDCPPSLLSSPAMQQLYYVHNRGQLSSCHGSLPREKRAAALSRSWNVALDGSDRLRLFCFSSSSWDRRGWSPITAGGAAGGGGDWCQCLLTFAASPFSSGLSAASTPLWTCSNSSWLTTVIWPTATPCGMSTSFRKRVAKSDFW